MQLTELEIIDLDFGHAIFTDEDRVLIVSITHEGVIVDSFTDGGNTIVGTISMMADEWFDFAAGQKGNAP
jgi:hypothetical protein